MQTTVQQVEKFRDLILNTFNHIWENPETGYKEWKTHGYLLDIFKNLGYAPVEAGNIPGFIADLDTGRPGPVVAVFGELDGLNIPAHPAADPETGAVHACGHCCQTAALVGIAAALKEPGALDGLCGRIRLVAVPAEELIEIEYRQQLRKAGTIRFFGGKQEFIYRGLLDGVDLAFIVHTSPIGNHTARCIPGSNGFMSKAVTFEGVAAHAGGNPHLGINALYAANTALNMINNLRETFRDEDHIRVHPIITGGGDAVNTIPDKVTMETFIRGANVMAIGEANRKVNRALAASAAGMGAKVRITDLPGHMPRLHTQDYIQVFSQAAKSVGITFQDGVGNWSAACSDMGDVSSLMPALHPSIGGTAGTEHAVDFWVDDPETACVDSAKMQVAALKLLLEKDGARAKAIVAAYEPPFKNKEEYLNFWASMDMDKEAVRYEDGKVILDYMI